MNEAPARFADGQPGKAHGMDQQLAALVELLDGMHLAPPERLPAVAAAAGRALDADVIVYLVDYQQHILCPLSGPGVPEREQLDVDTTLAGWAFRLVETLPSQAGGSHRLWVPLLDGVERLGVIEVVLHERAGRAAIDLRDPEVLRLCRWLSSMIGHLITVTGRYGDVLENVRLRRRRTPAAELLAGVMPPLTAGIDSFMLAGIVEPCYEVGGDAFDYALAEDTASLAIFDAVGHTLSSGLIASAAVGAYRSTRRGRDSLHEQATAIDRVIAESFRSGSFATGVLVELDLTNGRLQYVNAGHPPPHVLRGGKVVKPLTGGRRLPFGLGGAELTVGEESLQPDDWLVLHTDGITEALDHNGEVFGQARLFDFLQREAAAQYPPPETVRRLVKAVMSHQRDVLQDDATLLLARWGSPGLLTP